MKRQSGFTAIEILVVVAIAGIIMALGVPAFKTYAENSKIKSAVGNLNIAFQTARTEAVQRNTTVQLVLTTADPVAASVNTTALNRAGPNWIIKYLDTTVSPAEYKFLEGSGIRSGSGTNTASALTLLATRSGAGVSTFEFSPLSRVSFDPPEATPITNAVAVLAVTNPTGGACVADGGPMHCLNVVVTRSGASKTCDAASAGASDTRTC